MTDTAQGTWRVRIALTSTVKDGYRVGDATIEFNEIDTFNGELPREEIRKRLREIIEDGQQVADHLNHQNAIAKTTSVTATSNHQEGTK